MRTGRPSLRDKFIAALPATRQEIAKSTGISDPTITKWIGVLRAEQNIHIARWRRAKSMGSMQPVYVLGPGVDAPKLAPRTPKESQARYHKKHPGRRSEIHARSYRMVKLRKKGHGFFAALFM
jgi:hypothetical protein